MIKTTWIISLNFILSMFISTHKLCKDKTKITLRTYTLSVSVNKGYKPTRFSAFFDWNLWCLQLTEWGLRNSLRKTPESLCACVILRKKISCALQLASYRRNRKVPYKYTTQILHRKSRNNLKMWSTVSTARSSLKNFARLARRTSSMRTFGSVSKLVRNDRLLCLGGWFTIWHVLELFHTFYFLFQRLITDDLVSKNGLLKSRFYR